MSTPPNSDPASALAVNSAFAINPISVFENPMSNMKGVNSLLAKASPTLNSSTTPISAAALALPSSSLSGVTTDSRSERGGWWG